MRTSLPRRWRSGYISLLLVLSTGTTLLLLMLYTYRQALSSQDVQAQVQLRLDYSEKEDAVLRSIVSISPNRAIQAMQTGSLVNSSVRDTLRWQSIFSEAMVLANAGTSISAGLAASINIPGLRMANSGDSSLSDPSRVFAAVAPEAGYVSAGINRSLGAGFPPPLSSNDATTSARDVLCPIISGLKTYGTLAQSGVGVSVTDYSNFNLLKYPQINFGYGKPGEDFVAKRNWWAFSVDIASHDSSRTFLSTRKRNFVLSLYEIPSQLAISASSFMSLGRNSSGAAWQNVTIAGGIFAGNAVVEGNTAISALASRRGMSLSSGATIGGKSFTSNPFTPGVREEFQVTSGTFFPVSQASESGRATFIPINRGKDFFDRFSHAAETNVASTTSWNNYSIGALQCAMRMDVTQVASQTDPSPTLMRFSYLRPDGSRTSMDVPLTPAPLASLPAGFVKVCDQNQTHTFTEPVDVAYGSSGGFTFLPSVSGAIEFNNSTFGDPNVGSFKAGYWRPRFFSKVQVLSNGQRCLTVYPERFPALLASIGGATTATNHSLVVNVDYSITGLNDATRKPSIPCTPNDYGVILAECRNLTGFTKGFSLVTNLRLYIGDDFNIVPTAPPTGYAPVGDYFPPCSLFSPEKRFGAEADPFAVIFAGQIGSLAPSEKVNVADAEPTVIRPLDSRNLSGNLIGGGRITQNLRPIRHPAELPPISMMNWLIVLEELRNEFR